MHQIHSYLLQNQSLNLIRNMSGGAQIFDHIKYKKDSVLCSKDLDYIYTYYREIRFIFASQFSFNTLAFWEIHLFTILPRAR